MIKQTITDTKESKIVRVETGVEQSRTRPSWRTNAFIAETTTRVNDLSTIVRLKLDEIRQEDRRNSVEQVASGADVLWRRIRPILDLSKRAGAEHC